MSQKVKVTMDLPSDWRNFRMPRALNRRLHDLLDKQDDGTKLTTAERGEAEALVELSEMLSLMKVRATSLERPKKT